MLEILWSAHAGVIAARKEVDGHFGIGTGPASGIETVLHQGEEVCKTVCGEGELTERVVFIFLQ